MIEQILNIFVSNAYADTATSAAKDAGGFPFLMLFALLFFIYFAIWRPQRKRAKEQHTLMTSLAKGDEVMTAGGILGRVNKITDQYVSVAVANNVDLVLQKASIVNVLPKGTLKSIE